MTDNEPKSVTALKQRVKPLPTQRKSAGENKDRVTVISICHFESLDEEPKSLEGRETYLVDGKEEGYKRRLTLQKNVWVDPLMDSWISVPDFVGVCNTRVFQKEEEDTIIEVSFNKGQQTHLVIKPGMFLPMFPTDCASLRIKAPIKTIVHVLGVSE